MHLQLEDGSELSSAWLGAALARICKDINIGPIPAGSTDVVGESIETGSAVMTGQSFSVPLTASVTWTDASGMNGAGTVDLYFKTVAVDNPDESGVSASAGLGNGGDSAALRRDLTSAANELAFYTHVAPGLARAGVGVPTCIYSGDAGYHGFEYPDSALGKSRYVLLLTRVDTRCFRQLSPLPIEGVSATLDELARMHAAFWSDPVRSSSVRGGEPVDEAGVSLRERLWQRPTYWDLSKRGRSQLAQAPGIWAAFSAALKHTSAETAAFLEQDRVQRLGERMVAMAEWIDGEVHGPCGGGLGSPFATLVHGDFKAMNSFVPAVGLDDCSAVLIDWQWAGVGLAMADVAMHINHSVNVDLLDDDGEVRLYTYYYNKLCGYLPPAAAAAYTPAIAQRHYQLCLLDYGRVVISHFWKNVTPATMASKADNMNMSMVYRSVPCAIRFARSLDSGLAQFEAELASA